MFHKVTVIGHVGSDPETRYTQAGANVCSFSVATSRKWTNSDGSPGEETVWFRISAWSKLGEICQQYLHKGKQVFIEGELVPDRESGGPRTWNDQNGQVRASYEIRALTMKMLGSRDDAGNSSYNDEGSNSRQSAPAPRAAAAPAQSRPAAAPAQSRPAAPAAGGRRSTMSAPQQAPADDFGDFGPDDIPF